MSGPNYSLEAVREFARILDLRLALADDAVTAVRETARVMSLQYAPIVRFLAAVGEVEVPAVAAGGAKLSDADRTKLDATLKSLNLAAVDFGGATTEAEAKVIFERHQAAKVAKKR